MFVAGGEFTSNTMKSQFLIFTGNRHEKLRKQLENAAGWWEQDKIERAIAQFLDEEVPDGRDLLANAERRLIHIKVKKGESSNTYECLMNVVYL